jgi:hypothetical protein
MANERRMVMSERLIQSIERAADVLELFLSSSPELSVNYPKAPFMELLRLWNIEAIFNRILRI